MNKYAQILDNTPIILKEHLRQVRRSEKYYFYERDKGRLIRFDDAYFSKTSDNVEDTLNKNHKHKALHKALDSLSETELKMIDECFFYDEQEKKTITELAKEHNISRQAYTKRLKKILVKLRLFINDYYDEF
jgi:DNA-directed RNA polymerase sigma subunit (sigma70/sigma32)